MSAIHTPIAISHYAYDPSTPTAIVATTIFSITFLLTVVQWLRYRSWVMLLMVLASGMEMVGYIARILSIKNPTGKTLFVVQYCLVVLAPVLMAGACYVIFGRIIFHVVPKEHRTFKLLWISPRWLTPIFVATDIVALFLQTVGAVRLTSISITDANFKENAFRAKSIAESGVAVQLVCFGFFSIIAVRFNFTSKRFANNFEERIEIGNAEVTQGGRGLKYVTIDAGTKKLKRNWQAILRVTNAASVCILVRSVYRMVEFAAGKTGYPTTHEWCMYVFDALIIFPVLALFIIWHPGQYLPYMGFRIPKEAR